MGTADTTPSEELRMKSFKSALKYCTKREEIPGKGFHGGTYAELIPQLTLQTLLNYLFEGIPMGEFCQAVLANNLFDAVGRADSGNRAALYAIVGLVYNEFPTISRDYNGWLELHAKARELSAQE